MLIELHPIPKARPRVTKNGTFMPRDYTQWKQDFEKLARQQVGHIPTITHNVELVVTFHPDHLVVELYDMADRDRPKGLRKADIDNLVGSVMDALQDARIINDDRQVVSILARFADEGEPA